MDTYSVIKWIHCSAAEAAIHKFKYTAMQICQRKESVKCRSDHRKAARIILSGLHSQPEKNDVYFTMYCHETFGAVNARKYCKRKLFRLCLSATIATTHQHVKIRRFLYIYRNLTMKMRRTLLNYILYTSFCMGFFSGI